jgi:hypothetical protein
LFRHPMIPRLKGGQGSFSCMRVAKTAREDSEQQ